MAKQHPKGLCPKCGKKGLGVTFPYGGGKSYRQCTYCGERVDVPAQAADPGEDVRRDMMNGPTFSRAVESLLRTPAT